MHIALYPPFFGGFHWFDYIALFTCLDSSSLMGMSSICSSPYFNNFYLLSAYLIVTSSCFLVGFLSICLYLHWFNSSLEFLPLSFFFAIFPFDFSCWDLLSDEMFLLVQSSFLYLFSHFFVIFYDLVIFFLFFLL